MGTECDRIILYSPQAEPVWDAVMNDGTAYSRREYIYKKYEESAGIFLTAYDAYIREADKIVPRPEPWAYPYWAFASMQQVDLSGGGRVMKLSVPVDETVLFDQYDWYKVLRLSYIGSNAKDEAEFRRELERRGIKDPSEAVLRPFYPDIKRKITDSWKKIFRYDEEIKKAIVSGRNPDAGGVRAIQAGLWCIKKEWLI
ncbi:MAG: DUF3841 domain-containing protein [Mogibacterium sp.]|nr:DUF3841 domain-containing protein [Mogibacterium sp.]MBR2539361.1 DUF3841 domain-containing protein [Mogibacterium sp.]